jgi:hypothetical protein
MENLRTLVVDRTHLFPGVQLEVDRQAAWDSPEVLVRFSDGARTEGVLAPAARGYTLHVDAYRTSAGTGIPAKAWDLEQEAIGTLRVMRRVSV